MTKMNVFVFSVNLKKSFSKIDEHDINENQNSFKLLLLFSPTLFKKIQLTNDDKQNLFQMEIK